MSVTVSDEVKKALASNIPVVALESTIISHGMPYPENVSTAKSLETIVRNAGCVPATVAILSGVPCVGLTGDQIEHLGKTGEAIIKCSRRDLPNVISRKLDGACTVASTMQLASLAGVHVFATGGIGGVHRGAEKTLDISSDLREFGRTPMIVVCAGAKAILDLPKTLEYLETEGVPVVGYQTDDLPAFYSAHTGIKLEIRADTPREIADMYYVSRYQLNSSCGVLVTNPIPLDKETPHDVISSAIDTAVAEAETQQIGGKRVTPFLLKRITELTHGRSLASNITLVQNNVVLACGIAKAVAEKIAEEKGKK